LGKKRAAKKRNNFHNDYKKEPKNGSNRT
jgi:hypothetical protein